MKDMNLAKLTKDDVPLFVGILNDLFPAVDTPTIDYNEFIQEVQAELEDRKLQVHILLQNICNIVDFSLVEYTLPLMFSYSGDEHSCA